MTSSPVPRCVRTAVSVLCGAGSTGEAALDRMLGDPGPFVVEPEIAGPLFLETGILELTRRQLSDGKPPAGMRETFEGVDLLLDAATDALRSGTGLNVRLPMTPSWPSSWPTCTAYRSTRSPGPTISTV